MSLRTISTSLDVAADLRRRCLYVAGAFSTTPCPARAKALCANCHAADVVEMLVETTGVDPIANRIASRAGVQS